MTEKDEKAHLLTEAEQLLREGASETDVRRAWVLIDLHREWRMTRLGIAKRAGAASLVAEPRCAQPPSDDGAVEQWFKSRCNRSGRSQATDLYADFSRWCAVRAIVPVESMRAFAMRLAKLAGTPVKASASMYPCSLKRDGAAASAGEERVEI